jgi:hypothetical protein
VRETVHSSVQHGEQHATNKPSRGNARRDYQMKRLNDKFDNGVYEERRLFVETILEDLCNDKESVSVDAVVFKERCPWFIKMEYTAIRNRQVTNDSALIPIELALKISNVTLSAIIVDLLTSFRSE